MKKINGYLIGDLYKVVTTTTPTGAVNSTSNTLIHSLLIPANTFEAGDIVTIETCITKSATNNSFSQYFYYNTSSSLVGATLIATNTGVASTTRAAQLYRRLSIVTSSGSGNGTQVLSATMSARDDAGSTVNTGAFSTLAINWTSAVYIIVSGSVVSTSDTLQCQWIKCANG